MTIRHNTWRGPGRTYDKPDAEDALITANMKGRQGSAPKDVMMFKQSAESITAPGGNNQSGSDWGQVHEGVNPSGQGSYGNSKPSSS